MPGFIGARNTGRHGWPHQQARAAAFALLPEYSQCTRGRHTMWKWAVDSRGNSALHYDHNDANTGYIGFSCAKCNRVDGARKGRKAQGRTRPRRTHRRMVDSPPAGDPGIGW